MKALWGTWMKRQGQHCTRSLAGLALLLVASLAPAISCRQVMNDEPKYKPLSSSDFYSNGQSARPLVDGTVARGHLRTNEPLFTGMNNDQLVASVPLPITRELLQHGQERFNIFCSPCHGRLGDGNGLVAQRGLRNVASYHDPRLLQAPDGHFFDVVTNGFGAMYSYASRVPPRDRWAIIAYIRALQLSQHATLADVPLEERSRIEAQQ